MITDFRSLINDLDSKGKLLHINKPVSSEYEAVGILRKTKGEIPVCIHKIDNYKVPLVCNLGVTRQLIAESMEIESSEIISHISQAIVNPIQCNTVASGPVHQNVITAPFDVSEYFPILKHYEKDAGRFYISGVMVVRDPTGKKLYTSVRRMQYLGKNRFTILITSKEMKEQFAFHEHTHQPMDIAFMFGVVPAVLLGSQLSTHLYNADKLNVSSALLGQPLNLVKCKTVDLEVLADAEVVLEGQVHQWEKSTEGPFGEMAGYYGTVADLPVVELSAMTFRNNPIFQGISPAGCEEILSMAISREVCLLNTIRQTVPNVLDVNISMGGAGRFHAIIRIDKKTEADGRQAALVSFASDKDLKHVVVVDKDVDIFDMQEVEWAIATRVQADKDVFIIGGAYGSPLEPSHLINGTSAKMGIDATCPLNDKRFERTYIPGIENIDLNNYI